MTTNIQKFEFDGKAVEFDMASSGMMVNATEMGRIFGKKPEAFLRNEQTQAFINECLKSENSRFISVEKETDLVVKRQKSGTWMHRLLALKFAAWLDPKFELWVFSKIDDLLFGKYREFDENLRQTARIKEQLDEVEEVLLANPEYQRRENLLKQLKAQTRERNVTITGQLDLFRNG